MIVMSHLPNMRKQRQPVEVSAEGHADGEEGVEGMRAIGAAVDDHAAASRRAGLPVTGSGQRPHWRQPVPTEGGCVQHMQIVVEHPLQKKERTLVSYIVNSIQHC